MNICEDCGEVQDYDYGDRVRLVINPLVSGMVIGERNWGTEYNVRIVGLLAPTWYQVVELEPDPDFFEPATGKREEGGDTGAPTPANDNVIHVDFGKAPALGGIH